MDLVQSEDFEEFCNTVEELTEYYLENRYSGEPEDCEEALLRSPIPFMLNSGCQTLEEFVAMYSAWSIYKGKLGHEIWKEKQKKKNERQKSSKEDSESPERN